MSEKIKGYIKELNDGVKALFESQKYQDYLNFLGSFHSYSVNNQIAIFTQRPDARRCASFTDWKQKHNRIVRRGERGIKILCPHLYSVETENGNEEVRLGFHIGYTFDVSQTYGEDLPESPCLPVNVDVIDGQRLIDVLVKASPVPVAFEDFDSDANGYFSTDENRIVVKPSLSEAMKIRCLIHEIAHSHLDSKTSEDKAVDAHTREVRAESISYVVSRTLQLDTSCYSFGYVAGWSKDKTLDELKNSLTVIGRTVDRIIKDIEDCQQ